jgi:Ca2+-transporting ATPase
VATTHQTETVVSPDNGTSWYRLSTQAATQSLNVEPAQGLSTAEAAERLKKYGPNVLAETKSEPRWQAFLRQ